MYTKRRFKLRLARRTILPREPARIAINVETRRKLSNYDYNYSSSYYSGYKKQRKFIAQVTRVARAIMDHSTPRQSIYFCHLSIVAHIIAIRFLSRTMMQERVRVRYRASLSDRDRTAYVRYTWFSRGQRASTRCITT